MKEFDYLKKFDDEEFRPIKGFEERYIISNYGRVVVLKHQFTKKAKEIFSCKLVDKRRDSKTHYMVTQLYQNGKSYSISIHRLVALNFIPNPDNKKQVNHIDGNKSNNHISNLEWATNKDNQIHAWENGLQTKRLGSKSSSNKLVESDVAKIKEMLKNGLSPKEISEKFNCSRRNILYISSGKTWSHVK